jgi:hypothetical protein
MAKYQKWRFDVQTIGGKIEDEEGDESARVRDDGEELCLNLKTVSKCSLNPEAGNLKSSYQASS